MTPLEFLNSHTQRIDQYETAKNHLISLKDAKFSERRTDLKRRRLEIDVEMDKRRKEFEEDLNEQFRSSIRGHALLDSLLRTEETQFEADYPLEEPCTCEEFTQLINVIKEKKVYFPCDHEFIEWLELQEDNCSKEEWEEHLQHMTRHNVSLEWIQKHFPIVTQQAAFHMSGHLDGYKGDETRFEPDEDEPFNIVEGQEHASAKPFSEDTTDWDWYFDQEGDIEWPDHKSYWAHKTIISNVSVVVVTD